MSIECKPSNLSSDIRCAVCGQGFLIYAERHIGTPLADLRRAVQNVLREHHINCNHPDGAFTVDCSFETAEPTLA